MNQHVIVPLFAAGLLASGLAFALNEDPRVERDAAQEQSIQKRELLPDDIRKVQSALNEAGYDAGAVDGVWGAATTRALRDFQESKGLEATGDLDPASVLALGFSRDQFAYAEPQPPLEPADVRQVQEALNKAGYSVGSVDGLWGPNTTRSLREFQQSRGLPPTGKLDHDSVLALGLSVSDFAAGEFDRGPDSVNR